MLEQLEEDTVIYGGFKSRPLNGWLDIINDGLKGPQDKVTNANEMASVFKKLKQYFEIEKSQHYIPVGNDFHELVRKSKTYYKLSPKK